MYIILRMNKRSLKISFCNFYHTPTQHMYKPRYHLLYVNIHTSPSIEKLFTISFFKFNFYLYIPTTIIKLR